jgi:K+-sensing histidine kinase KdpD
MELNNNMENTKYENHRIRFYCDQETMEKLVNYDGSLIESKVKRVLTGSDDQVNITCQFSTAHCGKVVAQQRLINFLINALK